MDGRILMSKQGAKGRAPHLPRAHQAVQDELGTKLRQYYADMIEEPVPDRFLELLKQLEGDTKDRSS
jgi:hypothetical protein